MRESSLRLLVEGRRVVLCSSWVRVSTDQNNVVMMRAIRDPNWD